MDTIITNLKMFAVNHGLRQLGDEEYAYYAKLIFDDLNRKSESQSADTFVLRRLQMAKILIEDLIEKHVEVS